MNSELSHIEAPAQRDTFRCAGEPCDEVRLGEVLALCQPARRFHSHPSSTAVALTLLPMLLGGGLALGR